MAVTDGDYAITKLLHVALCRTFLGHVGWYRLGTCGAHITSGAVNVAEVGILHEKLTSLGSPGTRV